LFNFSEQFPDSLFLARQRQICPDIGERSKDKLPQVQPRVRQFQSSVVDSLFAAIEQININDSRNILWMIPFAA
jgi:hypothetical protein